MTFTYYQKNCCRMHVQIAPANCLEVPFCQFVAGSRTHPPPAILNVAYMLPGTFRLGYVVNLGMLIAGAFDEHSRAQGLWRMSSASQPSIAESLESLSDDGRDAPTPAPPPPAWSFTQPPALEQGIELWHSMFPDSSCVEDPDTIYRLAQRLKQWDDENPPAPDTR